MNLSKYRNVSDSTLISGALVAAQNEKAATLELLEYLYEIDVRRVYATLGFSSLFEYVHKQLGYSESQTSERVNAVRLIRKDDSVIEHLESGKLSLTSAAQIQRFLNTEKKVSGGRDETKPTELIEECLSLSKREVEKVLLSHSTEAVKIVLQERITQKAPDQIEIKLTITKYTEEKLKRAKELTKHDSLADLLDKALEALIEKAEKRLGKVKEAQEKKLPDPEFAAKLSTTTPPAELGLPSKPANSSRYIPVDFKKILIARSQGQCEWTHPKTHLRCRSRSHIEVDHIQPLALGGLTEIQNLRHLCKAHNLRAAQEWGVGIKP